MADFSTFCSRSEPVTTSRILRRDQRAHPSLGPARPGPWPPLLLRSERSRTPLSEGLLSVPPPATYQDPAPGSAAPWPSHQTASLPQAPVPRNAFPSHRVTCPRGAALCGPGVSSRDPVSPRGRSGRRPGPPRFCPPLRPWNPAGRPAQASLHAEVSGSPAPRRCPQRDASGPRAVRGPVRSIIHGHQNAAGCPHLLLRVHAPGVPRRGWLL